MNHLYEIATGRLVSSTADPIPEPPVGMAVKSSDLEGIWNTEILDFEPVVVETVLDRTEFLDLFTDVELDAILDAEPTDKNVRRFLKRLDVAGSVRMSNKSTVDGVNYMAHMNYIDPSRVSEILSV